MIANLKGRLATFKDARLAFACLAVLAVCVSVTPSSAQATAEPDTVTNPLGGQPGAVAAGKTLFQQTCQACHGAEGSGGRGPALNTGRFSVGGSDADLFHTIHNGVPGSEMPAFSALPANNIWQIISYIRSLSGGANYTNEVVPGDAAAGEKVFWGKGGCSQCHEVNGSGGIVGSDLSTAATNSAAFLRSIILNPNSPPSPSPRRRFFEPPATTVTVTTRQGQTIRGIVRAQDNYTLILTDVNGKLHRFDKSDLLAEHVETKSLMPANYGQLLSPTELENLIAYLKSLKTRNLSETIHATLPGGLSFARLRDSQAEPQNWLTYWGNYQGHHFSKLDQISPANVKNLQAKWSMQIPGRSILEATPLVVDGIMYTTGQPGQVFAIDAKSGLVIWRYNRQQKVVNPYQSNPFNRGVAMLGNRLFFGTLDASLVALDARTGRLLWETQVANTLDGYTISEAPLAIQGKVIVGVAGGEFGIGGFIDAYDAVTGKRLWRFYTIPRPGQPGNQTWSGDSWKHGGAPTWLTGSYDPALNLLYWGVGNPSPDLNGEDREGDNLFSSSVVVLDPDTGKLKWYYQFTPHDTHDWDATEDLVLADQMRNGRKEKLLMQADRNGMFYVLNRTDGKFVLAKPFVKETWNSGYGKDGRPILAPDWKSSPEGSIVFPAVGGGTNWQSPSYDAVRSTMYLVAEDGGMGYRSAPQEYDAGREYMGGASYRINQPAEDKVLAIDTNTGQIKWKFPVTRATLGSGVLATASGLVFAGTGDGNLIALDAKSGKSLWHFQTGSRINSSPMSYSVGGQQFVAISAGDVLYSFALPGK